MTAAAGRFQVRALRRARGRIAAEKGTGRQSNPLAGRPPSKGQDVSRARMGLSPSPGRSSAKAGAGCGHKNGERR